MAARIRKGDRVLVIAGRDKGKKGEVLSVFPKQNRLIVQGVQMVKRHTKPTKVDAGGIYKKESSIHISNVSFLDPKQDIPTRISFKTGQNGKKIRFSKKTGAKLDS